MRFATCCWWVSFRAFRNLLHWSSVTSRSSKASLRSYTVVWLRTLANCLRDKTSRLSSWSNNPKSGSMMLDSGDFKLLMVAVMSMRFDFHLNNLLKNRGIMHVWLHFHWKYSTNINIDLNQCITHLTANACLSDHDTKLDKMCRTVKLTLKNSLKTRFTLL